jgi:hypothetical protein
MFGKLHCSLAVLTSMLTDAGDIVAMMHVLALPPSESCSRRVSLLSLQGEAGPGMTCNGSSTATPVKASPLGS